MKRTLFVLALLLLYAPSASAGPPEAALLSGLCRGRENCHVRSVKDAGLDAKKRPLSVVDVGLAGDVDYDEPRPECNKHEIWLVVGTKKVLERQLLFEVCNDGYGARGVGEDTIEVSPNRVALSRGGGSSWGWTASYEFRLSPVPEIVAADSIGYWTFNEGNSSHTQWSWPSFAGHTSWSSPVCGDEERPPAVLYQYGELPIVELPKDWNWRTTALGKCSLRVDSADDPSKGGVGVVHGKPGKPSDATMKVLAVSEREFLVELTDDVWSETAKSWVRRDHVELWTGPQRGYMDHCLRQTAAEQWGIMLDGKTHAAHGAPEGAPQVEVVRTKEAVRMRVLLRKPAEMMTFVYSDSDDGKKQERLIATSALRFGEGESLGDVRRIAAKDAVCEVRDGKLAPKRTRLEPDEALLWDW